MPDLAWRSIKWSSSLSPKEAAQVLRQRAGDPSAPLIALEAWGRAGAVQYLLGARRDVLKALDSEMTKAHLGRPDWERPQVTHAGEVRLSGQRRAALAVDRIEQAIHALLTALASTGIESTVIQIVLGRPIRPRPLTTQPSLLSVVLGQGAHPPTGESRTLLRPKIYDHGFDCVVRIGTTAASNGEARVRLMRVMSALRSIEGPGLAMTLRRIRAGRLLNAAVPFHWPLRLNVAELTAFTAWPVGDLPLPGMPPLHPRQLAVSTRIESTGRVIGVGQSEAGARRPVALSVTDSLQHLHVLGPTGTGKSTLLLNLAVQDMIQGRGLVVVDPKGDLVADLLCRVPAHRSSDVVLLDPTDSAPVGLNPLQAAGQSPETTADGVLAVFHALYRDAWGPRTHDILHACLLTLTRHSDASLIMVPLLLTNSGFRRSLTVRASREDPLGVGTFWAWYEAISDAEKAAAIAPLMNKLRSVLLRPGLRSVIGQVHPRFEISDTMSERRILLVNLAKGRLGPDASALLGSLVVAQLWQATLARASVPSSHRHALAVYVDELQDYLHLPTDLADALAQARGLGVSFVLAHQFLAQLPPAMRAAVLANARSRVCFQIPHDDAVAVSRGHAEIEPEDFVALNRFETYASLVAAGRVNDFSLVKTVPPPPPTGSARHIRSESRRRYGRPLSDVEAGWTAMVDDSGTADSTLGRRPRRSS